MNQKEEVTPANLRDLFRTALYKTELDDDGDVKVVADSGMNVLVLVDESKTMLKYLTAGGLKEDAPESQKLDLINTLNCEVVFARFSMPFTGHDRGRLLPGETQGVRVCRDETGLG